MSLAARVFLLTGLLTGLLTSLPTGLLTGVGALAETWDMATPYAEGSFHTKNIQAFADDVAAATGGGLTIRVHGGGSLFRHPQIKNAVRGGQVPLGEFLLSRLGNENPVFQIDSVPFLATDYEAARRLWTASRAVIERLLARQRLIVLFAVPWPPQGLFADRPIKSAADLRGLKFRAYNAMTERLARLVGGVPSQIEVPDIPQAFATGRVQAMMTSPSTGADSKAWDYVDRYYHIEAWLPKNVAVVNAQALAALRPPLRQALLAAAARAERRGWAASRRETEEKLAALAAHGMMIETSGDELKQSLVEISRPLIKDWRRDAGADGAAILKAYLGVEDE